MKIIIGSKNPVKIEAVEEVLETYEMFKEAVIECLETPSGVSDQPKTLKETIEGACNRARAVFKDADFSFGIESGLMEVPYTKTGYMDHCICAIYDGKEFHLGMSSCFEYPRKVIRLVEEKGLNISQAFKEVGLTKEAYVGHKQGGIGILTCGRVTRKDYTKPAIVNALIHLENDGLY